MAIPRKTFSKLKVGDYFLFDYGIYIKASGGHWVQLDGLPRSRPGPDSAVQKLRVCMTYEVI